MIEPIAGTVFLVAFIVWALQNLVNYAALVEEWREELDIEDRAIEEFQRKMALAEEWQQEIEE